MTKPNSDDQTYALGLYFDGYQTPLRIHYQADICGLG